MSLNRLIIRQFVVSSVLLSAFQCSNAVRFSRSMQYPALTLRNYNYKLPWKYVPFMHQLPRTMQRRFMWKEMDDTVDGLMGSIANGARPITKGFSPPIIRYRKPSFEFDGQSSKKVKFILKKPPGPAQPQPFKRMKMMKVRAPNFQQPSIPLYNHVTIAEPQAILPLTLPSQKPSVMMPFMSEEELRKIEKEQEKRVESESAGEDGTKGAVSEIHEHSHQTHIDNDVVSGRINEFGADWLPMKGPFSTPKSFAMSRLHTKVEGIATILTPTALPLVLSEPMKNKLSYEVTEHSAEASVQKEHTFKPSTFNFDYLIGTTTTESPNYPEQFLKTFSKSEDDFQPMRVPTTTTTTTTLPSRRLPPAARTTTEHPFKRYHLHRPKPSKLLFHRTTSLSDSPKPTQTTTTTTTTTEGSYRITLDLQEPVKTTREPTTTTTTTTARTTTSTKRSPPEKVRNTRMNSEGKTRLRIKNVSQNEGLNKVLNQHRGSVKFGEKTKTR